MDQFELGELTLAVEIDREVDGRWIAEVRELPGVLAYGESRELAIAAAKSLADRRRRMRVIAWLRARARSKG